MNLSKHMIMILFLVLAFGPAAACGDGGGGEEDVQSDLDATPDPAPDPVPDTTPDTPADTPADLPADTPPPDTADVPGDEPPPPSNIVADHMAAAAFESIPDSYLGSARDGFIIYYGHTSHGSQVVTGIAMLEAEDDATDPGLYDRPPMTEDDPDLGYPEWEPKTRDFLNANPETNLVMWSWCGQMSSITTEEVDNYLALMSALETDYPGVTFVYMTGHLDGTGIDGTLYANNNRVRDYCRSNNKILYDFADIESYDPDGNYYPDETDACGWCTTWCETHTCPGCDSCAHSHCFNCYQKGKAFWWMMARLSGWDGG